MQKRIMAAAVLLIVQIGLTVAFLMGNNDVAAVPPDTLFLDFVPDAVQSVAITDDTGATLELVKENDNWTIPKHFSAPVDKAKLDTLLVKLTGLKQGFIVASSDNAAERFKVAATNFNNHIVIKDADTTLADFYVGTSPAFRQVHVRRDGSKDIAVVSLESYELETVPAKWLDRTFMKLDAEDVTDLEFGDFKLHKEEKGWQLVGTGENETAKDEQIDALVRSLSGLLVEDILDPAASSSLFDKPVFHFTAVIKDGSKVEYTFAGNDDASYGLKISDREPYGKVAAATLQKIQEQADRTKLVTVRATEETQEPAGHDDNPAASEPLAQ